MRYFDLQVIVRSNEILTWELIYENYKKQDHSFLNEEICLAESQHSPNILSNQDIFIHAKMYCVLPFPYSNKDPALATIYCYKCDKKEAEDKIYSCKTFFNYFLKEKEWELAGFKIYVVECFIDSDDTKTEKILLTKNIAIAIAMACNGLIILSDDDIFKITYGIFQPENFLKEASLL